MCNTKALHNEGDLHSISGAQYNDWHQAKTKPSWNLSRSTKFQIWELRIRSPLWSSRVTPGSGDHLQIETGDQIRVNCIQGEHFTFWFIILFLSVDFDFDSDILVYGYTCINILKLMENAFTHTFRRERIEFPVADSAENLSPWYCGLGKERRMPIYQIIEEGYFEVRWLETRIYFLGLMQGIITNLVAYSKRNTFSYSSGCQKFWNPRC